MPIYQKPKVFIFDIDGTIANHKDIRTPFDESRVGYDQPIEPVITVLNALLTAAHRIIFVSGRTEGCRQETIRWIKNHVGYHDFEEIELYMRQIGDRRKDSIIKKEIYDEHILPNYEVIGVFDDRMQVCEMLYENEIFCFNVNQGLKVF